MARILIVWGMWGPYHCRRLEVLREYAAGLGHEVIGLSLFSGSAGYQWRIRSLPQGVVHVDLGSDETRFPLRRVGTLLSLPRRFRAHVALLPAYGHWSLALNIGARLARAKVVMMNDTHGGTTRARGVKAWLKKRIVLAFHAAFVAGAPQRRYFASLGLPEPKIFSGYDAVDNDYFAQRAGHVRRRATEFRECYALPQNYFLSLGRFVPKKNLATLIRAYSHFLESRPDTPFHLVLVGSGEEESSLRSLCSKSRLAVYDHASTGQESAASTPDRNRSGLGQACPNRGVRPGVHFYGFRQIDENPVFYALADAFILPSLWEEWGLVVNEAMACGLPVVVSETAGCAEDLLTSTIVERADFSRVVAGSKWSYLTPKLHDNGFLFDPESTTELCGTLALLSSRPDMRAVMGCASRLAVEKFSCMNFARNALRAASAAMNERTTLVQASGLPLRIGAADD